MFLMLSRVLLTERGTSRVFGCWGGDLASVKSSARIKKVVPFRCWRSQPASAGAAGRRLAMELELIFASAEPRRLVAGTERFK